VFGAEEGGLGGRLLHRRRRKRMATPKRRLKREEVEGDPRLAEGFELDLDPSGF